MALFDLNRSNDTPIASLKLASITPRDWPTLPAVQSGAPPAYVPTVSYFGGVEPIFPWREGQANVTNDFNPKTQAAIAAQRGVSQVVDVTSPRGWIDPGEPYGAIPAAPVVTSLSPTSADTGTDPLPVTITGTGFTRNSTVKTGTTGSPSDALVTYVSPTSLIVVMDPRPAVAGLVAVSVYDHSVQSNTNVEFEFTAP